MAKTEDIEAKLAAYVDEDLDAPARAEIERHLAGNPTHRQLIDELIRQRQLLKNLPRQAAPGEVAEAINAQLERAVLLGDVDGGADAAALRIGNWSHIRAIAAVLLLTASLAALILYLLPESGSKPSVALNFQPAESGTQLVTTPEPVESPVTLSTIEPKPETLAMASPAPALASASPATRPTALAQAVPAEATVEAAKAAPVLVMGDAEKTVNQMFRDVVQPHVGSISLESAASPVVYVMPTSNPEATNQAVTQYLLTNNIQWETRPNALPSAEPVGQSQLAFGERLMVQQSQLKQPQAAVEADQQRQAQSRQQAGSGSEQRLRLMQDNRASGVMLADNQIVAKQVTRVQAAELRAALDAMQSKNRIDTDGRTSLTIAAAPFNAGNPDSVDSRVTQANSERAARNDLPATPVADAAAPPATLPVDAQLSLAPSNTRPPGAESVSLGQSVDLNARAESNAAPATQEGMLQSALPIAIAPTTEPGDAARVDFVIVVKAEAEAPATQPTTEPAPGN